MTTVRAQRRVDVGALGGDEDDVDVARVVDLLGAVLAHGDHGQAVRGPRKLDGAGEYPVGELGEGSRDLLEIVQADEVPRRDLEHAEVLATDEVLFVRGHRGVPREPARLARRDMREDAERVRVGDDDSRQRAARRRDRRERDGEAGVRCHLLGGARERREELFGHEAHRFGSRRGAHEVVWQR